MPTRSGCDAERHLRRWGTAVRGVTRRACSACLPNRGSGVTRSVTYGAGGTLPRSRCDAERHLRRWGTTVRGVTTELADEEIGLAAFRVGMAGRSVAAAGDDQLLEVLVGSD